MQWMKGDTAAIRIVDWVCEQVIEVHEHRREHDEPRLLPVTPKEQQSHRAWNDCMKNQMGQRAHVMSMRNARHTWLALIATRTFLVFLEMPNSRSS